MSNLCVLLITGMEWLNVIIDILFHLKNISTHTTYVCKVETSHINYNDMSRGVGLKVFCPSAQTSNTLVILKTHLYAGALITC